MSTMTLDTGAVVEVVIDFICPFCGGKVRAGHEVKTEDPVLFHTMPYCKTFEDLSPDLFLEKARKRMQS